MKIKSILISAGITAIILGVVGGVVRASYNEEESQKVLELEAMMDAREQVYVQTISEANTQVEQAISEANSRIEYANQTILTVEEQKKQVEQQLAAIPTPLPSDISSSDALNLALQSAGLLPVGTTADVELIEYDGKPAYEIKMGDGTSLYVDAISGEVMYNSLIAGPGSIITSEQAIALAKEYLPYGQVLSVELEDYADQPAYKVTFYDGSEAFVSLAGQVLAVTQIQTSAYYVGGSSAQSSGGSGGSSNSSNYSDDDHDDGGSDDDSDDD